MAREGLTYTTASGLASRVDNADSVRWANTKRMTYELQDIADIVVHALAVKCVLPSLADE